MLLLITVAGVLALRTETPSVCDSASVPATSPVTCRGRYSAGNDGAT